MAINKELREDIKNKHPGLTQRRVDQKINEFAKERKIVGRDIAACAYARDVLSIDITRKKYSLDNDTISKIQTALQAAPQVVIKENKSTGTKKGSKPKSTKEHNK